MTLPVNPTTPGGGLDPMSVAVDRVLERLHDVRRARRGWRARCPGHADRRPSLDVLEGDDGRVLLVCRAGCRTAHVLVALDLRWVDLFPVASHGPRRSARHVRRSPLDEARHEVITEARRHARRLAPYRETNADADSVRVCYQVAAEAQRVATRLGDCNEAWALLEQASYLQTLACAAEARHDLERG
jgi:hypothetical protein